MLISDRIRPPTPIVTSLPRPLPPPSGDDVYVNKSKTLSVCVPAYGFSVSLCLFSLLSLSLFSLSLGSVRASSSFSLFSGGSRMSWVSASFWAWILLGRRPCAVRPQHNTSVSICIIVSIYVYLCTHTYICIYLFIHINVYIYINEYIYIYIFMYVCMFMNK